MENQRRVSEQLLEEFVYKPTTITVREEQHIRKKSGDNKFLFASAVVANLLAFAGGICFAWTSPVIPRLNGSVDPAHNPLGRPINDSEASWIASLLSLGAAVGPLAVGKCADSIGRKKTLLLLSLPLMASFVVTAYAQTVTWFYVARFFMGFALGSIFAILPTYLGEIAEDHNRGLLGCLMGVFVCLGLMYAFAIGPYFTVKEFSLLCLAPFTIFVPVFFLVIPESPQFLGKINDQEALEDSLQKLRSKSVKELQEELNEIRFAQDPSKTKRTFIDLLKTPSLRRGLVVSLGLMVLQQLAGINAVISYMQSIFDASKTEIAPEIATILVGGVQVVATIITSAIVEKLGRRILLLTSASGSCLSLVALGGYFYLQKNNFDVSGVSWLPIASLLVYIVSFNLGMGPVAWAMMAELFPGDVRSVAASLTSVTCFLTSFVVTLFFPPLALMLGMAQSFWLFALFCFGGVLFIYLVVPETKGRTLQEIQVVLGGGKV